MKALILAAEGSVMAKTRQLPTCLQPVTGGSCLLEQQIRKLNLLGIDDTDICVVIGVHGSWALEPTKKCLESFRSVTFVVNSEHLNTTSESSFYKALPLIGTSKFGLICINSDSIIDLRHLESLTKHTNDSSLLVRKPSSVNQEGVHLQSTQSNKIGIMPNNQPFQYPWYIYAGVTYISTSNLACIMAAEPNIGTGGLIYSLDNIIGLEAFNWVDYDQVESYSRTSESSRDLTGGSFAALKRSHLVRKQAIDEGCDKLLLETMWLEQLPSNISPYFPPVIDSVKSKNLVWYDMPWYDLPSLRKNILTGAYSAEKTWDVMKSVLDFMFSELYTITYSSTAGLDWVISKHLCRVKDRIEDTIVKSPDMKHLIKSEYVLINGKKYLNLPRCLIALSLKVDLLKLLAPNVLRMIHGDLHFQNILVGPSGNDRGFILADPRGELEGSDLYYDMGKLWHSFNGLYDLIHTDLYTLNAHDDVGVYPSFTYSFSSKNMLRTYSQIKALAPMTLEEYPLISSDPLWHLRTLFSEAMHFSSVMAFHLHLTQNNARAILLYLQGVKLMNEFIVISELHKYQDDPTINNTMNLGCWLDRITST